MLSRFNTQEVANTASAYAGLEMKNEAWMGARVERTMLEEFLATVMAHDVANTAWTYATLDLNNEALMEALDE